MDGEMRKQLMQYLFLTVLISVFLLVFSMSKTVEAETLYVDDAGGTEFSSIQAAINAANESDTIEVYSGTYNENLVINKTLTLSGAGAETTSIIGVSSDKNTVEINADNVNLSGFLINNNAGKDYPNPFNSLKMEGASFCTISQNIIEDGENGLYLIGSNNNLINSNIFRDNNQKGIFISHSDSNSLDSNIVKDNGDGIYLYDSNSNEIFENEIKNNNFGLKIATKSNNNVMYKNDFDNNYASNANDSSSNIWSKNQGGNYWDDYDDYDIVEPLGIGDSPYIIDGDSQDSYPLGDFLTVDPVAHIDSISPNPATVGESIYFYGHGTPSENIVDWEWRTNKDGLLHQGSADFSSSSLSVGTHIINFRVKDISGQWSEYDTENLVINSASSSENQVPVSTIVSISPAESVEGESVYMHGYGTDADGMIVGYSWQSNKDGLISADSSFTITSLSVGTHSISFKVKDNDGDWSQSDTATIVITQNTSMNQNPVVILNGPYSNKINTPIIFDVSASYDPDTEDILSSYDWDFGDGKTGSGEIITHSYNQSGNYTVTLTVEDSRDGQTAVSSFALVTNQSSNADNSDVDNNDSSSAEDEDIFSGVPAFEFVFIIIGFMVMLFYTRFSSKK